MNQDNKENIDSEIKSQKYEIVKLNLEKFYSKYDKEPHKLNLITKMATVSSALRKEFEDLKFVGFYIVENSKKEYLEIGPYVSDIIATPIIKLGNGVCGSSWKEKKILIENNVAKCNNYIACDEETKSEIVVPVFSQENKDEVIAVWDIDSIILDRFDEIDISNISIIVEKYL